MVIIIHCIYEKYIIHASNRYQRSMFVVLELLSCLLELNWKRMTLCLVLACQGLCFSLLHMFFIPSMIHSSDRCGLQLGRMAATVSHFQLLCWARLTVSNWALDARRTGCVCVTLGFNVWHTLFTCKAYKTTYFRIIRLCKKACHNSCEVMKGVWVFRKMFRCWMLS